MSKKAIVFGYYNLNLGDDLFMEILKRKLKDYSIDFLVPNGTSNFYNKSNGFNIRYYSKFERRIDRLAYISFKWCPFLKNIMKSYDITIVLGGSLFIENNHWKDSYRFYKMLRLSSKKLYIIGCNFGPYQSKEFLESYRRYFKTINGITVRDNYSKEVLNLSNVKVYPDFVFNLDFPIKRESKKVLGVSVINLNQRNFSSEEKKKYYSGIIKECLYFSNKGYSVRLFSFCKAEGDEEICKMLASKVKNATIINYNGNIHKVLSSFSECQFIIATRFHAVILGWNFGIPTLPIVYSPKTLNIIKDLNPNIRMALLNDPKEDFYFKESDFSLLKNIRIIKNEAKNHLEFFEK